MQEEEKVDAVEQKVGRLWYPFDRIQDEPCP
jgi:hypothetical protein